MRALFNTTLVIACLPLLVGADIYRWVDKDGVVNYTQQQPKGVDAKLISSARQPQTDGRSAGPAPARNPADRPQPEPNLNENQQRLLQDLQAAEEARRQEVARVREENCKQARSALDRLTAKGRIRVRGEDGEVSILGEDERQQRISDAQQGVAVNCDAADA